MAEKLYCVEFVEEDLTDPSGTQTVRAAEVRAEGEYLTFLKSDGSIAAFFLRAVVKTWNEVAEA